MKELCIRTNLKDNIPHIIFVDYQLGAPTPVQQFLDDDDQEMIEYYMSMLGLFSEICYDRNYKGIFSVESLYKFDTVLACMRAKTLPFEIRAHCTKMLLCVHVDREPQCIAQLPNYTRTQCHTTPGADMPSEGRDFQDVKQFILEYFDEMGGSARAWDEHKNQMTLHVLDIVHFLVSAGFYSNLSDMAALVNPLVHNLDGTNDQTFDADDQRTVCDSENQLRYHQREGTVEIMEAKLKMCRILTILSKLRLDNRITELLTLYDSGGGSHIDPEQFDELFQGSEVDFQKLSDKNLVAILTDLIMYKHDDLKEAAFNCLITHFTQRQELIVASERVQLLTDDGLVKLHDQVKADLAALHALVETEELWLGEEDAEDRVGQLVRILKTLLSYCQPPDEDAPSKKSRRRSSITETVLRDRGVDVSDSPAVGLNMDYTESKGLLRNLGAHRGVVDVLKIERLLSVGGPGLDMLCLSHRFLQAFAEDSPGNSEEIAEFMDLFLQHLSESNPAVVTAAAETLGMIGTNDLTPELVQGCLDAQGDKMTAVEGGPEFDSCSMNLACLELLTKCTKTGSGKPNKTSQMLIIKHLMDPQRLLSYPTQHQWLSESGAEMLFSQSPQLTEALLTEPANIQLINLLVECCRGKNGLVQAKCQGVFSLQDLASHMDVLKQNYEVKTGDSLFTHYMYSLTIRLLKVYSTSYSTHT